MRTIIIILFALMLGVSGNIIVYILSDDYRFFLKKIKYQNEVVYQQENVSIDDTQQFVIVDSSVNIDDEISKIAPKETVTFLEAIGGKKKIEQEESLPVLTSQEQEVLGILEKNYILRESSQETLLFGLTDEYPDLYRTYSNAHIEFYMFSTKRYEAVKNIFDVLSFELPIELNQVNNIAERSFFINMQEASVDGLVRIVFEYENYVFGLKIKKDNYNRVKQALEQLEVQ